MCITVELVEGEARHGMASWWLATRQMCRWGCKADKIDWQGRLAARLARHAGIWICKADKMDLHTQRQH